MLLRGVGGFVYFFLQQFRVGLLLQSSQYNTHTGKWQMGLKFYSASLLTAQSTLQHL